jgi:hypothetical protein
VLGFPYHLFDNQEHLINDAADYQAHEVGPERMV